MTYSITNVRRDNDKIFASVNGVEYTVRKSGGSEYAVVSLLTGPKDGKIGWGIRCHRDASKIARCHLGWTVSQVVSID